MKNLSKKNPLRFEKISRVVLIIVICKVVFISQLFAKDSKDLKSPVLTKYNVIVIMLDSIRADHLSCYGYARKTSPAIDKLASEGILFEQAISQSSWSLPAQCSILTSRYVPSHGVDNIKKKLADSELTLAEILKTYGYKTAAFTGGFWISSVFNVGQGFDIYNEGKTFAKFKDTNALALSWLKENKDSNFFLFIQGFDGHSPFELPKAYEKMFADPNYNGVFKGLLLDHRIGDRIFGRTFFLDYKHQNRVEITNKDIEYIIDVYDGAINYADKYIGDFLNKLDELNLSNNTIIILSSYHGTPLFEHGIILKRKQGGLREGSIHVPLIIRHPDLKEKDKRISNQVQHIDIMPTILDFLGIPINHQAQGKSLIPLIEGKTSPDFNNYVYSSGFYEHNKWIYREEMSVRAKEWKLIKIQYKPFKINKVIWQAFELYEPQKDPNEQNNVIQREPEVADKLKKKLSEWIKQVKINPTGNRVMPQEIDKIKDDMKKTGYWFLEVPENKKFYGHDMAP